MEREPARRKRISTVHKASIAIEMPDGEIKAILIQVLGFPDNVGRILREHYQDKTKIFGLINLGSLIALGKELGEPLGKKSVKDIKDDPEFMKTANRQCIAVARDAFGENVPGRVHSYSSIEEWAKENAERHRYIYREEKAGDWSYGEPSARRPEWLTPLAAKIDIQDKWTKLFREMRSSTGKRRLEKIAEKLEKSREEKKIEE